jgi:hypothetical protein
VLTVGALDEFKDLDAGTGWSPTRGRRLSELRPADAKPYRPRVLLDRGEEAPITLPSRTPRSRMMLPA